MIGLAMHLIRGHGTLCGTPVPESRRTHDPKAVNCLRCRRTIRREKARAKETS